MNVKAEALVKFINDDIVVGQRIDVDTDLLLSGAVDSLGVVRITHWMEEEAGVVVDPGDVTLENFQSVGRMVAYLERVHN